MIKVTSKKLFTVYSIAAVLLLLYILSFTVFSSGANRKQQKTQIQLLHEADISLIDNITIQNAAGQIILRRQNNMWLVTQDPSQNNFIPADTQLLQKLFVNLASKHIMYKSGKKEQESSYGLSASDVTAITLYKNSTPYQTLYFGNQDFTQTQRYFTTDELNSVYLMDASFDTYLSVSAQIWCDPYIISAQLKDSVFQMGDIQSVNAQSAQKLTELRHGGFADQQEIAVITPQTRPVKKLVLDMGDKSVITINIYNSILSDNDYVVQTIFDSSRTNQTFGYYTKISLWTYNKINEITL